MFRPFMIENISNMNDEKIVVEMMMHRRGDNMFI